MTISDNKEWLEHNGILELFHDDIELDSVAGKFGTTGMWVGNGKLILTTQSNDPVGDLFHRVKCMLWYEIDTAYLDE